MYKQTAVTSLDSYKIGHADQYPENITKVYSNFTPRSMTHFNVPEEHKKTKQLVWVGMQMILQEFNHIWQTTFFDLPWAEVEAEVVDIYGPFVGPNGYKTARLKALHELGYLPLEIKALPEATLVPVNVPVFTIQETHPDFAWLTNSNESWLSAELWKPSTAATTSLMYRLVLEKWAAKTGSNVDFKMWQLHDFCVRGMSYIVDAAKTGIGHLLLSRGTDNVPAVKCIRDCYHGKNTFVGGSIPATEHSVMCAGGKESEIETFRRLIRLYPKGAFSVVSDTWNFWNVVGDETSIAAILKDDILNREPDDFGLAKVVFRPDSGDPVEIICGLEIPDLSECQSLELAADFLHEDLVDAKVPAMSGIMYYQGTHYEVLIDPAYVDETSVLSITPVMLTPAQKGAVECLADIFGTTTNEAGYRTVNQRVGLIYGEAITVNRADEIFRRLAQKGFAADNVVFGIGSYAFQYVTRDSLGFAMKATYVTIEGEGREIFKDPATDSGTKKSAKGLLRVEKENGVYVLYDQQTPEQELQGELMPVYRDGNILVDESFEVLRERLMSCLREQGLM